MAASNAKTIGLMQELEAAQRRVTDALKRISGSELHAAPAEGEWTVAEICAHVIEMQTLWLKKISNVDKEPKFERSEEEIQRRTGEIEAHASDDIDLVRRRLQDANNASVAILQGIEPAKLDISTERGTAEEDVRARVINHLSDHAEQIVKTRVALRGT